MDEINENSEHKRFIDGVMLADIKNLKCLIDDISGDIKDINNKISHIEIKIYYLMGISTTIIIGIEIFFRFFVK